MDRHGISDILAYRIGRKLTRITLAFIAVVTLLICGLAYFRTAMRTTTTQTWHTGSDEPVDKVVQRLAGVGRFAFGGVGFVGVTSEGEIDLTSCFPNPHQLRLLRLRNCMRVATRRRRHTLSPE